MSLRSSELAVQQRLDEFDPRSIARGGNSLPPVVPPPLGPADIISLPQPKKRGRPRTKVETAKKYTQLSEQARAAIRRDAEMGRSYTDLARLYHVGIATVSRIAKGNNPRPRGGSVRRVLTPSASRAMAAAIIENPQIPARKLAVVAQRANGGTLPAVSSVNAHLRSPRMNADGLPAFSITKAYLHEPGRHSPQTLDLRAAYVSEYRLRMTTGRPFVFVDESPWNINVYHTRGRAPVGQRCVVTRRRNRPRNNITAITAICVGGIIHSTFVIGSVNELVFRDFLATLFTRIGRASTIVMDNVGFHNTRPVEDMITAAGHCHLRTAPNSCELNPIEYVFHAWKSRVQIPENVVSDQEIVTHLDTAFRAIPVETITACIGHVEVVLFPMAAARQQLHLREELLRRFPDLPVGPEVAVIEEDE